MLCVSESSWFVRRYLTTNQIEEVQSTESSLSTLVGIFHHTAQEQVCRILNVTINSCYVQGHKIVSDSEQISVEAHLRHKKKKKKKYK